jgi:EAL domain-containing protein (putative c-di-GMP-specific phosphodiesterase class I)
MEDTQIIELMLESINSDNRTICERSGMDPAQVELQIEQSQDSLRFMLTNVLYKLKEQNVIA